MKTLLLIYIFALSLKAESMYQGKCVTNVMGYGNTSFVVLYSNGSADNFTNNTILSQIMDNFNKFEFDSTTGYCIPKTTNYNYLGLTEEQFNISMAFYGIFLSSLIAFGLIKAF
ncbi:MAG: hypothetical protein PHG81_11930 [Aliarcobacter sp.]|nr:hypothetical protein [Aliarcobacter sp.]